MTGCGAAPSGRVAQMAASDWYAATPEAVWAIVGDPKNDALWRREVIAMETDRAPGPGAVITETVRLGLNDAIRNPAVVVAWERGRRLKVRGSGPEGWFTAERVLKPERGGTRLRYVVTATDGQIARITLLPLRLDLAASHYAFLMRSYLRALHRVLAAQRAPLTAPTEVSSRPLR